MSFNAAKFLLEFVEAKWLFYSHIRDASVWMTADEVLDCVVVIFLEL